MKKKNKEKDWWITHMHKIFITYWGLQSWEKTLSALMSTNVGPGTKRVKADNMMFFTEWF